MREIYAYFLMMPCNVVREFAKRIDGKVAYRYNGLAKIEKRNEEAAADSDFTIEFILDSRTTKSYICGAISGATPIIQDKETGIHLYEKRKYIKREIRKCQIYYVVCKKPITPRLAYKVYKYCLNQYTARARLHSTSTST